MVRLALRQLRFDLGRSTLTCVGIAAVFAVILFLQGFHQGLRTQLRSVVLDRGGQLIATQTGVRNMVGARSVIPQMARAQVESVEGIRIAHPMTTLPLIYERDGRKSAIFLMVVDIFGSPDETLAGRLLQGDGEILIDRSVAQLYNLVPGDNFTIAGYDFEIVGVVEATAALWTPIAFSNYGSLIEFYFESNLADDISAFPLVSYLLIELQPNANPQYVARLIENAVPDVDVFPPPVLARNDEELGETMLGAVVSILIAVAYGTGLFVIALFMFAIAEGRRRDLGILKAIGFGNRAIVTCIIAETVILTLLAIPLGIAIAYLMALVVHQTMPIYLIEPTVPGPLLRAIIACGAFAFVGAFAPLHFVRRVEPMEIFQS